MLDEKTPMRHKLFILSFSTTLAGFLAGVSVVLISIGLISKGANHGIIFIGLGFMVLCLILGKVSDNLHGQIRNYIMRPYVPGGINDSEN